MKLSELSESIAATCDVRSKAVLAVQKETFRQLRAALDKGERVIIPEFGRFSVRDIPEQDGKPAQKIIRFRLSNGEEKANNGDAEEKAAKRKAKKSAKKQDAADSPNES